MIARLAFAAALATACVDNTPRPPGSGAGGGGGGNQPNVQRDAGADGGFDAQITGSLCRLTDLRFVEACSRVDLSGIDIGIRGSSATALTDADGNFAIDAPGGPSAILEVGFNTDDVKSSIFEITAPATGVLVPMVLLSDYLALIEFLLVFEPDGTGSMAIYARDGPAAVADVEVVPPAGSQPPLYDAGSAFEWSQLGLTGLGGAALIFAVSDEDRVAVSLVDSVGSSVELTPPIEDGALTFAIGRF